MYKYSKVDADLGLGRYAPGAAVLYSLPSIAALGLGGYGLSKLLGIKKKHHLAIGLPAAYLAYVLGKTGNGLGLWDGIGPIDDITHRFNNAVHSGLSGLLNEEGIGNRLYYGGKLALEGALKNDTHIPESGEGVSLVWHYNPDIMLNTGK